jgi:hypothetical protein
MRVFVHIVKPILEKRCNYENYKKWGQGSLHNWVAIIKMHNNTFHCLPFLFDHQHHTRPRKTIQ